MHRMSPHGQPAAEVQKHPPLKTSWPADRTTTLTGELFAKGPAAAGVAACRNCHARAGEVPKLLSAIPEIKHESSTAINLAYKSAGIPPELRRMSTEVKKPSRR
jgi:cytochrome c553